ncbi:MAG: S9 family peptidase [Chloroflexi bacterium]|nr:S9 family peptidase [Chloroflexota bacterium]
MVHGKPYGEWPSPISPRDMGAVLRLGGLAWDTAAERLVWLEGRGPLGVLVCGDASPDAPREVSGSLSVRARVGYGGGDFSVDRNTVYFAAEGRLYRRSLDGGQPRPITPAFGQCASPTVSPDGQWVVYVHSYEDVDGLAIVDADGQCWPQRLAYGSDFVMQPRWHPDGQMLAWVSWDFPNMPWDGTRLETARLAPSAGGWALAERETLAGGERVAIFQPEFSPDGRFLAYISDESGWGSLYLRDLQSGEVRLLVGEEAELGLPAWAQDVRTYAWSPDSGTIYYCRHSRGYAHLWAVQVSSGERAPVPGLQEYSRITQVVVSPGGQVACLASGPAVPRRVISLDPVQGAVRVRARSEKEDLPAEAISEPQPVTWRSAEGDTVHGLYYPPRLPGHQGAGAPPLIVRVHGGPTSQVFAEYLPAVTFFTTRGYAVLEVNYRGSTGYGKAYTDKLRGTWGIVDSDDAVSGARYAAEQGWADATRTVIMGGSAGGFTVLQSLIRYPGVFRAGLCLYGVADLFGLAADTHKFERHYTDLLVGPLPEAAARYRERSPVFSADQIRDPLAVFQGEEDPVVPKAQAEAIVAALKASGVRYEYHVYPGEGHGWRKPETVEQFYSAVLAFLAKNVLYA